MRFVLICLCLSACVARPVVDWPPGAPPATPGLLPLQGLIPDPVPADPGPGVAARGAALRDWAASGR
ncbi:hypothetical protein [Stagnihabitans tardus]|uniref:Uncharacterized protein n=1 Tax=Stagnihabitans tardus TaxID=2699202 RepID=A0AAE4YEB7_9RHOB|nr:hypothetical protein [Stagnihabitans tardus]NBZ90092.1 hypothetical protein [Stagnihabitans tardus]